MKKGHRRTQSANLASSALEEPPVLNYGLSPNRKLNVMHLLQQSQLNTKQKVCNIEKLNSVPRSDCDKLFNFGKGLQKINEQSKPKADKYNNLVSIPQKSKTSCRTRKANDADHSLRIKAKVEPKTIVKINVQQYRKGQIDFAQSVNKLIKIKLGGEVKNRKLSMYEPGRSTPKQLKHKKDISNAK